MNKNVSVFNAIHGNHTLAQSFDMRKQLAKLESQCRLRAAERALIQLESGEAIHLFSGASEKRLISLQRKYSTLSRRLKRKACREVGAELAFQTRLTDSPKVNTRDLEISMLGRE